MFAHLRTSSSGLKPSTSSSISSVPIWQEVLFRLIAPQAPILVQASPVSLAFRRIIEFLEESAVVFQFAVCRCPQRQ